jgi:1,4-alpha-glucan branching enzyme
MGCEFGQSEEWAYAGQLQWHLNEYKDHSGISMLIKDLNRLYRSEPALAETDFDKESFRWIACWDCAGFWREILNTNSSFYGGDDAGNGSGVVSEAIPFDDCDNSAEFVLPPCSTMIFKWEARG